MTHAVSPGYILTQKKEKQQSFVIAGTNDEREKFRTVLAIGPTFHSEFGATIDPPCKVGETILVTGSLDNYVRVDGEEYIYVKFSEVMDVIEEDQ